MVSLLHRATINKGAMRTVLPS